MDSGSPNQAAIHRQTHRQTDVALRLQWSWCGVKGKGHVEHLHSLHAGPEADGFQLAAGVSQAQTIAVVLKLHLQVVHLLAVVAARRGSAAPTASAEPGPCPETLH